MRNRLYSAWVRALLFWWTAAAIDWAFSNDEIARSAKRLGVLLPNTPVTALNAAWVAGRVFSAWSARVLAATLGAVALGAGAAYVAHYLARRRPLWALRRSGKRPPRQLRRWRGIEITLGVLPQPQWAPGAIREVEVEGLRRLDLPQAQERLLREVISWVAAQKNAYVGPGHTRDLLAHTLRVVNRIATDCEGVKPEELGLLLVLAAAHDAGKALVWERAPDGKWRRSGWHDEAGARVLSQMPGFADLTQEDQRLAVLVLAYAHKPSKTPVIPQTLRKRYAWLRDRLEGADRKATHAEQQATLTQIGKREKDDLLLEALGQALRTIHFQVPGIKPGLRASAWRTGNRVYLLEPGLRTALLKALPKDLRAAYGGDYRRKGTLAPVMTAMLAMLEKKGWVITEHNGLHADPPLWRFRSGSKEFSGVIALDLPDEHLAGLPRDTHFAVTLLDPVFPFAPPAGSHPPPGVGAPPGAGAPAGRSVTPKRSGERTAEQSDGGPRKPRSVSERGEAQAEGPKGRLSTSRECQRPESGREATADRPPRMGSSGRRQPNQAELGELAARTGISVDELRKRLQNQNGQGIPHPTKGDGSPRGLLPLEGAQGRAGTNVIRFPGNETKTGDRNNGQ